jgi:hypothetical protein
MFLEVLALKKRLDTDTSREAFETGCLSFRSTLTVFVVVEESDTLPS